MKEHAAVAVVRTVSKQESGGQRAAHAGMVLLPALAVTLLMGCPCSMLRAAPGMLEQLLRWCTVSSNSMWSIARSHTAG